MLALPNALGISERQLHDRHLNVGPVYRSGGMRFAQSILKADMASATSLGFYMSEE